MLPSATVMIGKAVDEDVYSLTPDGHSVGMVKEVSVPMDSSMITHANGVSQAIVASKRTGVQPTISFTSYEFTAQNVMRSRSEEHTSELQSLMRISYAVFCLKKKNIKTNKTRDN